MIPFTSLKRHGFSSNIKKEKKEGVNRNQVSHQVHPVAAPPVSNAAGFSLLLYSRFFGIAQSSLGSFGYCCWSGLERKT